MPKRKPILIGCPQYHCLVLGSYERDEKGAYRLGPGGEFLLERARCGHRGGRCSQTLCALHRLNQRGPGSWYPTGIWAAPAGARQGGVPAAGEAPGGGWYA
jgi:hypothetical protein